MDEAVGDEDITGEAELKDVGMDLGAKAEGEEVGASFENKREGAVVWGGRGMEEHEEEEGEGEGF